MNTVVLICTLLGGIAAIYGIVTYQNEYIQKPKELKDALWIQFNSTQQLANEVRQALIQYAKTNNAYDQHFLNGITFEKYIAALTTTLDRDLSNELWNKVSKEKLTEPIINSMSKSLEDQFNDLLKVKSYFTIYFK